MRWTCCASPSLGSATSASTPRRTAGRAGSCLLLSRASPMLAAVVIVLAVVALLLALLWALQRRLIYLPFPADVPPATAVLDGARDVTLRTADGLELGAWFVAPGEPDRRVGVLVATGNAGDRSLRAPLAAALAHHGLAVLLFDYRGYGGNRGRPTQDGLARDVRAALRFLARRRRPAAATGCCTTARASAQPWSPSSRPSIRPPVSCSAHRSSISPRWAGCTTRSSRSGAAQGPLPAGRAACARDGRRRRSSTGRTTRIVPPTRAARWPPRRAARRAWSRSRRRPQRPRPARWRALIAAVADLADRCAPAR